MSPHRASTRYLRVAKAAEDGEDGQQQADTAPTSRGKGRWAGAGGCLRLREEPLLDLDEEEAVRRPPDEDEAERLPPVFFCDVAIAFEILSQEIAVTPRGPG